MSDIFGSDDKEHSAENLVEVAVSQLQIGMFVAELDKPWLETPFLVQGFELRSNSQIQTLMAHCKTVFILRDGKVRAPYEKTAAPAIKLSAKPSKLKEAGVTMNRGGRGKPKAKVSALRRMEKRPAYEPKSSVRTEHKLAREAVNTGKVNIKGIMNSVQMGQMIDTDVAENTVSTCVHSIMNNPDAMIWMSRIKDENQYTAEHCLNVCILAIAFGRHLRLTESELGVLGICGLLHDVGKMKVPQEILDKPGALTEEEFSIIKQHTVDGHRLLTETVNTVVHSMAKDVVLNHHERPDGSGYPRGLDAGGISEFSRIIAVVDAYDAITSNRCYSRAKSPVEAQKIIFENRGKQFDEEIALEFIKAIGPYPPGTIVELRNGMVGIVLTGKHKFRHLPTVVILRDQNKNTMDERTVELHLTDSDELSKEFLIRKTLTDGQHGIYLKDYRVKDEEAMF